MQPSKKEATRRSQSAQKHERLFGAGEDDDDEVKIVREKVAQAGFAVPKWRGSPKKARKRDVGAEDAGSGGGGDAEDAAAAAAASGSGANGILKEFQDAIFEEEKRMTKVFRDMKGGDKGVDAEDLVKGFEHMGIALSLAQAKRIVSRFDKSKSGKLEMGEFIRWVREREREREKERKRERERERERGSPFKPPPHNTHN